MYTLRGFCLKLTTILSTHDVRNFRVFYALKKQTLTKYRYMYNGFQEESITLFRIRVSEEQCFYM